MRAADPIVDTVDAIPYMAAGSIHNDSVEPGAFEANTRMLGELDAGFVDAVLDHAGPHAPVPHVVEVRHLGGRLDHRPATGNAVEHRDTRYAINVISRLEHADIESIRPAHRRMIDALMPFPPGGRD